MIIVLNSLGLDSSLLNLKLAIIHVCFAWLINWVDFACIRIIFKLRLLITAKIVKFLRLRRIRNDIFSKIVLVASAIL